MSAPCDKCKGEGLVPRENVDPDMHPILSRHKETCPTCGGSGRMPPMDERRRNIAAQAAASG